MEIRAEKVQAGNMLSLQNLNAIRLTICLLVAAVTPLGGADAGKVKTFGTVGKEQRVLQPGVEAELFRYSGKGCLTHMWFGGNYKNYGLTRIRIYVDDEKRASIDMEMMMGHGIGFQDEGAPWGIERIGKTGQPSGIYNTYRIPFGRNVRVTAQRAKEEEGNPPFWWIIRGVENLPVELGGVRLPDTARLRLYKVENRTTKPLEEIDIYHGRESGALYQVTIAGKSSNLCFLESCVRAYVGAANISPHAAFKGTEVDALSGNCNLIERARFSSVINIDLFERLGGPVLHFVEPQPGRVREAHTAQFDRQVLHAPDNPPERRITFFFFGSLRGHPDVPSEGNAICAVDSTGLASFADAFNSPRCTFVLKTDAVAHHHLHIDGGSFLLVYVDADARQTIVLVVPAGPHMREATLAGIAEELRLHPGLQHTLFFAHCAEGLDFAGIGATQGSDGRNEQADRQANGVEVLE